MKKKTLFKGLLNENENLIDDEFYFQRIFSVNNNKVK